MLKKKKTPRKLTAKQKREALYAKRSKASKLGWTRRKASAEVKRRAKVGKKISKELKRYHKTGLTKAERERKASAPDQTVLIAAPAGEEIPAFQLKDQVEADPSMQHQLDAGLAHIEPGDTVTATFTVSVFAADGTKQPDKEVKVPVVVSDPHNRDQFWRDFYNDVRDDLEEELYGEDAGGGSSAVTCSSVAG